MSLYCRYFPIRHSCNKEAKDSSNYCHWTGLFKYKDHLGFWWILWYTFCLDCILYFILCYTLKFLVADGKAEQVYHLSPLVTKELSHLCDIYMIKYEKVHVFIKMFISILPAPATNRVFLTQSKHMDSNKLSWLLATNHAASLTLSRHLWWFIR